MDTRRLISRLLLLLCLPAPVLAADGVIEINQTCAIQTGCTPSDTPGFPVTIGPGSYRLTGSLEVPEPAPVGLDVLGSATIDFNGFALRGDITGAQQKGVARQTGTAPAFITIRNGLIEDFDGGCIEIGDYGRVEDMTLIACEVAALTIGDHGQVISNRIVGTTGQSLVMGASTAYRDNQITSAASTLAGGIATGTNVCDGRYCEGPRLRRVYTTPAFYDGSEPTGPGVCEPGFHFASIRELTLSANLVYDFALGPAGADTGDGGEGLPPFAFGWIRTGSDPDNPLTNCNGWTNASLGQEGTTASHKSRLDLDDPAVVASPWSVFSTGCHIPRRVWCIEDAR